MSGEYAVRGFILDLYPIDYEHPIRIEFDGNIIENIKYFNENTQMSMEETDKIKIKAIDEMPSDDKNSLFDYAKNPLVVYVDKSQIEAAYTHLYDDIIEYKEANDIKEDLMYSLDDIKDNDKIFINLFSTSGTNLKAQSIINYKENFEKSNIESDLLELRNYKFLKKHYKFECLDNEVPIILFQDNVPVAAGRLDLVLKIEEDIGLGDIKRTSVLDKEYLAYQLNLYRIGYQQCYDIEIKQLKALHLRENTRKYVNIPINEEIALELLKKYLERGKI